MYGACDGMLPLLKQLVYTPSSPMRYLMSSGSVGARAVTRGAFAPVVGVSAQHVITAVVE